MENSAAPTVQETSRSVGTTRLLRLPEVMARTGLSRATIYRWIKSDLFPAPRKCGSCTFWRESDVHEWINNLV
ncbi:MAG: AlpA family phage regulatory protein [Candidatus Devosia phytovorans]|uniref:AlpA family phage regulatory protein n=1 Tax=Candidatus Devosia phytovorans TaxID=3121372 RepID=A0AAJ5VZ13_9HYPH|nr:AlpA family phage regulatory protein [Devosia sp.]WEK06805.1 MAG: AlpA family phage regulatory protein [Devosia sp.]